MNEFPSRCVVVGPVHPSGIYKVHGTAIVGFNNQNATKHDQIHPQDATIHPEDALTLQIL